MKRYVQAIFAATALVAAICGQCAAQRAVLRDAPLLKFLETDSNSPCHWDGNTMYLFNSAGRPKRTEGPDQFHLSKATSSEYDNTVNGSRWIECAWKNDDGVLYGWYHNEPKGLPRLSPDGSEDRRGKVYRQRPALDRPRYRAGSSTKHAGVPRQERLLRRRERRLLLHAEQGQEDYVPLHQHVPGDVFEQGVSIARMAWKDRDKPVGKVRKYFKGEWNEPGVGGWVTPIFPAKIDWKRSNADAFWGPAVHWNTYLKKYVMLLNRTAYKPGWPQEGVYISYSDNPGDPMSWTLPKKIFDGGRWYPEAVGVNAVAKETDKLMGKQARFYMGGISNHEIIFFTEGDDTSKLPPVYEGK